jgi:hypothetical protein
MISNETGYVCIHCGSLVARVFDEYSAECIEIATCVSKHRVFGLKRRTKTIYLNQQQFFHLFSLLTFCRHTAIARWIRTLSWSR